MRAIDFKGTNCVYAENQSQYIDLPVHKTPDGVATSCWKLSFVERIKVLFKGKIYLSVMTFDKPLQPLKMDVDWQPPN